MGVPYKLDKKIVKFIIDEKQLKPQLGCRSFVELVKAQFGFDISKSTINAVIKEAGLSKRVGRPRGISKRSAIPETRKPISFKESPLRSSQSFVLPFEKKEGIQPSTTPEIVQPVPPEEKPIILPQKEVELEKKPEPPVEIKAEKPKETPVLEPQKEEIKLPPEPAKIEKPIEPPKEEKPKKPAVEPKPVETAKVREIKREGPSFDVAKFMQPISVSEEEVIDAMGAFFLKAAEAEISKSSILGNVVRELIIGIDPLEAEIKSNILLYSPAFGIESIESLDQYRQQGLWVASGASKKFTASEVSRFLTELGNNQELFPKLYYACDKNFKEALYFKFILADGTVFLLDARLKSIWQEPNIPDNFTVTQNKAKRLIDEKFIQMFTREKQPLVLFNVPSFRSFSPVVSEFIYAMEDNPQKRILEIDTISVNNQELESHGGIVPAKRYFMFGFWPWQQEAKDFLKGDIGVVKDFYFPELARQIYYSERQIEFPAQSQIMLNAIFLKNSAFSSPRIGILTNVPEQLISTPELIKFYLLHWPNFEDTYQDILSSSERLTYRGFVYPVFDEDTMPKREQSYILPASTAVASDNIKTLLSNLSISCQRHFFPYGYRFADFATMRQRFYGLPGKVKRKDKNLYINLIVPKDYQYSNDLFYAVRRINESDIIDPFGNKIWFKVL
ncbi:MAG: hypothetical protein PHI86_01515 [Candidatus Omnitrophica bacterium]|nr:hypothetical protein [Candidatus Omnitrophota bacterium]HOX54304.1 hypothetical protein [Candidatus Omnitrophota bacterium]